jgi:hypothetical protein
MRQPFQISTFYLQKIEALKITGTDKRTTRKPSFRFLLFWGSTICFPKVAISPTNQYVLNPEKSCDIHLVSVKSR